MKNFKELFFISTRYNGQIIKLQMFVSGINSGVYDKALHIQVRITEKIEKMLVVCALFKKMSKNLNSALL